VSNSNKNTFGNMIENLFNKESKPVSKKKTTKKSVKKKATITELKNVSASSTDKEIDNLSSLWRKDL